MCLILLKQGDFIHPFNKVFKIQFKKPCALSAIFANTLLTLYGAYSGILTYFTCFLFDINYHPLSETFFPTDEKLAKNVKKTSHPIKKSANSPRHPSRTPCNQLVLPAETS